MVPVVKSKSTGGRRHRVGAGALLPLAVAALRDDPLLERLLPLLLLSNDSNWLADDTIDTDLKFLLKQNL